jgi:hypothetical protein
VEGGEKAEEKEETNENGANRLGTRQIRRKSDKWRNEKKNRKMIESTK